MLRGIAVGVVIAMPIGPVGLLCIRETLSRGVFFGVASGGGALVADIIYGAIGGLGLAAASDLILRFENSLEFVGAGFLIWLGIASWRRHNGTDEADPRTGGLISTFFTTFALTLANPITILAFIAIFAAMGVAGAVHSVRHATALIGGVAAGSAACWFLLTGGAALFRNRITPDIMLWINRGAGVLLLGFAAYALLRAFEVI